jgi:general secretion pathway protein D
MPMKHSRIIQSFVCISLFFVFFIQFGCAAGKPTVEVAVTNGPVGQEADAVSEDYSLESSEAVSQEDLISSPFGNIPVKKSAESLAESSAFKIAETPVREKPVKMQSEWNINEQSTYAQATEQFSNPIVPQRIEQKAPSESIEKNNPEKNESSSNRGDVVLNFDNADLYEVVRTIGEILQLNYIVDPNVRGRVTINTAGRLSRNELFPVFFQILEANGLTAVKEGNLYKIIRMKEATQFPLSTRMGDKGAVVSPGERMVIQIIPLRFISSQEMTRLITPFVTAGGTIVSHIDSNTLLVVDKASNIEKILRLTDVFDIDLFKNIGHRFFRLQYVDAEETGNTVNDIIASYAGTAKEDFKLIPLKRINSLLLISKQPNIFSIVQSFVRELDVPVEDDKPRIYVYSVKNGVSAELATLLNSVFSETSTDNKKTETVGEPERPGYRTSAAPELFPATPPRGEKVTTVAGERISAEGSGTLRGDIKITPDEIRNSLIIEATPRDYRIIETILTSIDVLPRQVLIEVTIAEIALDSSTELGIEWRFDRGTDFVSGLQSGATLGSTGINFSYAILDEAKRWMATVSALAQKGKVNILSSPSVLASDSKEARIDVTTEVPVATSIYTYDSGRTDNLLETSIQYRNTGVILSVTPHINEFGLVSMDVNQEVSEQAGLVNVGLVEQRPSFFKRSVNTTLTVKNGQTIVIGGLIRETSEDRYSGIPCIGNVPVLAYVLGTKSKATDKTELIIFITPKVIASLEDVDLVSEEFRNRIGYDYESFKRPGSR